MITSPGGRNGDHGPLPSGGIIHNHEIQVEIIYDNARARESATVVSPVMPTPRYEQCNTERSRVMAAVLFFVGWRVTSVTHLTWLGRIFCLRPLGVSSP
jgi:hypothetical protein